MVFGAWRPFGVGGHPVLGDHDVQKNNTKLWRITTGVSGPMPKFLGTDFGWDVSLTYNRVVDRREMQDILVDRLQDSLNGLGGPNCVDRSTPGANGCQYFNPFSSAIERNIYTGQINPRFVGARTYAGYTHMKEIRNSRNLASLPRLVSVNLAASMNWQFPIGSLLSCVGPSPPQKTSA